MSERRCLSEQGVAEQWLGGSRRFGGRSPAQDGLCGRCVPGLDSVPRYGVYAGRMSNSRCWMCRAGFVVLAVALLTASSVATAQDAPPRPLVFLTRDGCVNTTTMRERLDQALGRLKIATEYAVVDVETLPEADIRRGYGTPTVLYAGRDLFGMPEPTSPAAPT